MAKHGLVVHGAGTGNRGLRCAPSLVEAHSGCDACRVLSGLRILWINFARSDKAFAPHPTINTLSTTSDFFHKRNGQLALRGNRRTIQRSSVINNVRISLSSRFSKKRPHLPAVQNHANARVTVAPATIFIRKWLQFVDLPPVESRRGSGNPRFNCRGGRSPVINNRFCPIPEFDCRDRKSPSPTTHTGNTLNVVNTDQRQMLHTVGTSGTNQVRLSSGT